jgi:predicted cobalt transporter CbtA
MVKNLFVSAICAGIAAGLLASVLQFTFVIPVLLEGELYETGARVHFSTDPLRATGLRPLWAVIGPAIP